MLFDWRRGRSRKQSPRRPMSSSKPPQTPEEILRRVLRLARLDGMTVLVVAGVFALGSLAMQDYSGAAAGFVIASAGAVELRGRKLLLAGQSRGLDWLVGSQLWLVTVILLYAAWRLQAYDPALMKHYALPLLRSKLVESILTAEGLREADALRAVRTLYIILYLALGVLSFCFQGGLALYYRKRRAAVTAALAAPGSS